MSWIPSLADFSIGDKTSLDFNPPWPDSAHQFERREAVAILAALLSGRPLLIEGPPGSGKTQVAAAAAAVLGRELIVHVVNSDARPEDLLWRHDALRRLNDAQAKEIGDDETYIARGALWQAFEKEAGEGDAGMEDAIPPYRPKKPGAGKVVLIDEIDKADRSVPNSLLDVLGHRRFYCPHVRREIVASSDAPLVIITSNREQQLPPAFVRRCLVLRLQLPTTEKAFSDQLAARAAMHFGDHLNDDQYREIALALWEVRQTSGLPEDQQPGQAEYLDLVRAIAKALKKGIKDESRKQLSFDELLQAMQGLTFDKAGEMDQAALSSENPGN